VEKRSGWQERGAELAAKLAAAVGAESSASSARMVPNRSGVPHSRPPRRVVARALERIERIKAAPVPPFAPRVHPPKVEKRPRFGARPLSKREQIARRAARFERDAELYLKRFWEKVERAKRENPNVGQDFRPKPVPLASYRMCWEINGDWSGGAARIWLRRYAPRFPHAVGAIRRAALVPIDEGAGKTVYDYSDLRARRIIAEGLLKLSMAQPSNRRDQWRYVTIGLTHAAIRECLKNPWNGRKPTRGAIGGWHRVRADDARRNASAALLTGQLGYGNALKLAGFCYSVRLHRERDALEECERGYPSGYAPARYFITARPLNPAGSHNAARRAALLELERSGWFDVPPVAATRTERDAARGKANALDVGPQALAPPAPD
jgi:hypothetical protein